MDLIRHGIIQKSPVAIMPIPVADQGIYDKHIPEVLFQQRRWKGCLVLHSLCDIRQFCTIAAVSGIDHRIFQRCEVLQHDSW